MTYSPDEGIIVGYLCKCCGQVGGWDYIKSHECKSLTEEFRDQEEKKFLEHLNKSKEDMYSAGESKDFKLYQEKSKLFENLRISYWYNFQLPKIQKDYPSQRMEKIIRDLIVSWIDFCGRRREELLSKYEVMRKQGIPYSERKKAQELDKSKFDLVDSYENKYKHALNNHIIKPFNEWIKPDDYDYIIKVGFDMFIKLNLENSIIIINNKLNSYDKKRFTEQGYYGPLLRQSEAYY